jgi:hypothetical protein
MDTDGIRRESIIVQSAVVILPGHLINPVAA